MKSHPMFERWRATLSVFCSLAVLLSCGGGGGVDSGGTGAAPPATLASGPVTGLGSVTVNGVRFDDSTASVVDQDDMALTTDQLQVGMSARIDASAVATSRLASLGDGAHDPYQQRAHRPGRQRRARSG